MKTFLASSIFALFALRAFSTKSPTHSSFSLRQADEEGIQYFILTSYSQTEFPYPTLNISVPEDGLTRFYGCFPFPPLPPLLPHPRPSHHLPLYH